MVGAIDLAERIIRDQEAIIGPLAWSVALEVDGLTVEGKNHIVFSRSGALILGGLVKKYERLFGPASREVCRDAVRTLLPRVPAGDVPEVLK